MSATEVDNRRTGRTKPFPIARRAFRHVLDGLAQGLSVDDACARKASYRTPSARTFMRWIHRNALAWQEYQRAKELGAEYLVSGCLKRLLDCSTDDPARLRALTDHARTVNDEVHWQASKLLVRRYGDRMQHEHSGAIAIALATGIPGETMRQAQVEAEAWPDAIDVAVRTAEPAALPAPAVPASLPAPAAPAAVRVEQGRPEPARPGLSYAMTEERRPGWLD